MSKRMKKEYTNAFQDESTYSKSKKQKYEKRSYSQSLKSDLKKESQVKQEYEQEESFIDHAMPENRNMKYPHESNIKESTVYYEKILQNLNQELKQDSKDVFAYNALQESISKEVALSCHSTTSHCLQLLLPHCQDGSEIQRFMKAFAEDKVTVFTSANASHITEILICYAVKAIQNWPVILESEDSEEKSSVLYCMNWLSDLGEFMLENLNDCLLNTYSCHVSCTLVQALSGDLSKPSGFMSKSSKSHKEQLHSQYTETEEDSSKQKDAPVVLEKIPKFFSKILKKVYKSLLELECLHDLVRDGSSATVVEALLCALKKRLPKSCKKMIAKLAEIIFLEKNMDNVPLSLLHRNCSFIVNEMFKAAVDDLQLTLWNLYIESCLGQLVSHPVGHFVVQRLFEVISDKSVFEKISESIWCYFDDILKSRNFGIFLTIANACCRLSAQQAPFMKHTMQCLRCHETEERQNYLLPLLLDFQQYNSSFESDNSLINNFQICLQGSLVAQAVLKFHKPFKVVQSILAMPPSGIENLARHIQGCHVLNAFFGSVSVGEKNKEKLLNHIKPVMLSIASDRHSSLTLSRIWVLLSLKLKEIIARELAENKEALVKSSSGYAVFKKFGIHYYRHLQEWREIQTTASYNKNTRRR